MKPVDPTSTEFLQALRVSEVGAQIASQIDAQKLAERRQLADELAKVNAAAETDWPRLVADVDKAAAAVRKAEEALRAARDKHARAVSARTAASAMFTVRRRDLEAALTESAHPAIAEAQSWARSEIQKARKAIATSVSHDQNVITGRRSEVVHSNATAIRSRILGLNAMLEALGDLSMVADQSNVLAAIDQMRAALPEIGG